MKKIKSLFTYCILSTIMMFSCSQEASNSEDIRMESETSTIDSRSESAVLGYFNQAGQFTPISDHQLELLLKSITALREDDAIVDITIIGENLDLRVNAASEESTTSLSTTLFRVSEFEYAIAGPGGGTSTCTCTSTGCPGWGCNASDSSFPCSCSDCGADGTCTKTSSSTTAGYVAGFFN